MITYVNRENAEQYSFLYSKASEDLRTHDANGNRVEYGDSNALKGFDPITLSEETYMQGRYYTKTGANDYTICNDQNFDAQKSYYVSDDISSLDEYFSYIVQLNEINRRYTILPLDEDVFEIDANTRAITVPQSFQTNGISVQGDEVAEIVYFKIRRFYDAIDLDTKDIYIQWRSAAKDEDGNPIDGVSVPWVKDVESAPGFIIFGWPLSSKITAKAGQIQFAVRFYEFDNEKDILTYSLSTLTQTATIKPALDFNLPNIIIDKKLIDDATGLINDRFENSEVQNGAVKAEQPEITLDLAKTINLARNKETGFLEDPITLNVQARSKDGGQISYVWKKYGIRPADHPRADLGQKYPIDYEITMVAVGEDEVLSEDEVYFQLDGKGGYIPYVDTLDRAEWAEGFKIYRKYSTGTLTTVGEYYVIVTNRVRASTATIETTRLIVPLPVTPVIETDEDNLPVKEILLEKDNFAITLEPAVKITDEGVLTYRWLRKGPGETAFTDAPGTNNKASYTIEGTPDGVNPETEGLGGDGYYKVEITNNLNGEWDTITSGICRVTHTATACEITKPLSVDQNMTLEEIKAGDKFIVEVEIPEESGELCQRVDGEDTITYQWYRYFAGLNGDVERDAENAQQGLYITDSDEPCDGANEPEFQPTEDGYYYCKVTNIYNGTQAEKNSMFFRAVNA
jgi:hypothetical protein